MEEKPKNNEKTEKTEPKVEIEPTGLTAEEYSQLQHSAKRVDRDDAFHFKLEKDEDYVNYLVKDAIRSMLNKVEKTGTSQDPEEWTEPPEYSKPATRKDFVMVIVKFRNKFRGLARSMDNQFDLKTDWFDNMNSAGQQIVKYIDLFRKSAKISRLDEIAETRKRVRELQKIRKDLAVN